MISPFRLHTPPVSGIINRTAINPESGYRYYNYHQMEDYIVQIEIPIQL